MIRGTAGWKPAAGISESGFTTQLRAISFFFISTTTMSSSCVWQVVARIRHPEFCSSTAQVVRPLLPAASWVCESQSKTAICAPRRPQWYRFKLQGIF